MTIGCYIDMQLESIGAVLELSKQSMRERLVRYCNDGAAFIAYEIDER